MSRRTDGSRPSRSIPCVLGSAFMVLAAAIVAIGWLYNRNYQQHYRAAAESQLSVIADLKVADLANWRRERMGDASVLFNNDAFSTLVSHLDSTGDAGARKQLRQWLGQIQTAHQYDRILLLDAQGAPRMAVPDTPEPLPSTLASDACESLRSGKVSFSDFHRDTPEGPVRLSILVPIFDTHDARGPLGELVLQIDPGVYLYPFIQRWPTPSSSAETLLVRRDKDDVLFLNELRFKKDAALKLRFALKKGNDLPCVKAVSGQEGIVEGPDYRGIPVIAAVRAVPDSPWFLVARMDQAEVYAPVRRHWWLTVAMVGVLLVSTSFGLALFWRQKQARFYREKFQMAEAMRASEARYRRLFETAQNGILILDAGTGMVVDVNPFLVKLLGFSRQQFLGKKIWELGFAKDIIANQAGFAELQEKKYVRYEDMPLETADGRRIDVEFVSNVYEVNHHPVVQCNICDISERKMAKDALRRRSEELALANGELTRFAYTVSHDLKSPLVTIKTFLGYLEKDMAALDAQRVGNDLGYIRTAADRMSLLLGELLELSRVGRKMNVSSEASLQNVVKEALAMVAGHMAARGVKVEITAEPIWLYGDRPRLVEVFQNLLDNAAKFMGDQPSPRIEVGARTADGLTVLFVSDNGMGIDPRHQSKLFGLFEKLDPRSEGTGLGLALVRRVVEVHGGRIWVESEGPGKGTTFRFTLARTQRKST